MRILIPAYLLVLFWVSPTFSENIQLPQGRLGENIKLAWTYFHDGNFQGALDLLESLRKEYPENSLVEHTIGYFHLTDRNWDKAAKFFQDSLLHETDPNVTLWNHIYLAEIFKEKSFFEKATGHLEFVEKHDMTSLMIRRVAKIKADLRIMKILDSSVFAGNIQIRFPHYLLPRENVEEMGKQLVSDWKRITDFLQLSGNEKFEVFVYPSERLLERYFPPGTGLQDEDYTYGQIHTVYHGTGDDYLSALAPYGYYLLSKKYNRYGASLWMINGLDDAIRETWGGVTLNAWVSELYDQQKLPSLMFLTDPAYVRQMDIGIRNPTAGSFILFLKKKFHPNDFLYMLAEPNIEFNFDTTLENIETEWIRYARHEQSLLENKAHVAELVEKVEAFNAPPVVGKDLMDDLKTAASLNDLGKVDESLVKIETILRSEPRYGDALYLKGKILYDKGKYLEALDVFLEAIKYIPQDNISSGWAKYFLGRIYKLKEDYLGARDFYSAASVYPLPTETLDECRTNLFKLEKYLAIRPHPSAVVPDDEIQGINEFLLLMDEILNSRDWNALTNLTAFSLNEQGITNFIDWYKNPARLKENTVYTHKLVKSEVEMNTTKIQVVLTVSYPDVVQPEEDVEEKEPEDLLSDDYFSKASNNKKKRQSKEYTRYILLTRLTEGWKILDYFDKEDLYR